MEKKEKRFSFNFLDALLLIIFVLAVAVLAYIFFGRGASTNVTQPEKVNLVYIIETKEVREELRGLVSVGDALVDTVSHYSLGEVINVQYSDMIYTGFDNESGLMVDSVYPGHIKLTLTVSAEADVVNGQYSIGGYRISPGVKVYFRVPNFTHSGYCISLSETD